LEGSVRGAVAVLLSLLTLHPVAQQVTVYETVVWRAQVDLTPAATPIIDSLITREEWEAIDAESLCLYHFLVDHFGWEITLDRVLAGGAWTDELGGACALIGEDDE
jgi:hypothetical protein